MAFYTFLPKILNMSVTASVAIVFVLLLRLLLKKAPKVISYALWAVVLIRLLCPVLSPPVGATTADQFTQHPLLAPDCTFPRTRSMRVV